MEKMQILLFLVNVTPDDFFDNSPLAGIYFQKDLEEKAFILGGRNYYAPVQRVEDFIKNQKSTFIGSIEQIGRASCRERV